MKVQIYVRNLTKDTDTELVLPMVEDLLREILGNDEYIILDSGEIDCDEYENIMELNKFLTECDEEGIDLDVIKILRKAYLWKEVVEVIKAGTFTILDTSEIDSWAISGEDALGLFMYENGYNDLPCKVPEELVDYIDWEANWTGLTCSGWELIRYNETDYVVHR